MFHRVHPRSFLVSPYKIETWLNGSKVCRRITEPIISQGHQIYCLQLAYLRIMCLDQDVII